MTVIFTIIARHPNEKCLFNSDDVASRRLVEKHY